MNTEKIKILLVDDSAIALEAMNRVISKEPDLIVVGKAKSGQEALQLIPTIMPDIVCTDYYMSGMDGLELTSIIMEKFPTPVLVVSGLLNTKDSAQVFPILEAGALDVIGKPPLYPDPNDPSQREFLNKLRVLSRVYLIRTKSQKHHREQHEEDPNPIKVETPYKIVCIGASTGGPAAIKTIIELFPPLFSLPILCVQHMSPGFTLGLVEWMQLNTKLRVKTIETGEIPQPGVVYFPIENYHLLMNQQGHLIPSRTANTDQPHRPSIDVMMQSVARRYGSKVIGVLLTGMGTDGVLGLEQIFKEGGATIAQDPSTCIVANMPQEAINKGVVKTVLPLTEIGPYIYKYIRSGQRI